MPPKTKSERNRRKKENAKRNKTQAKSKETKEEKELLDALSKTSIRQNLDLGAIQASEAPVIDSVPTSGTVEVEGEQATKTEQAQVFEVKKSTGKGLGVFATCDIKKGAEIFREAPLLLPSCKDWLSIEASYAVLSEEKKLRFMALHSHCNCKKSPCVETPLLKIWDVNSFEVGAVWETGLNSADRSVYVYEMASRINHSCVPNTTRGFKKDTHPQIVFHAFQDIKQGEEIYTDYTGACGNTQTRRQVLSSKYGFNCRCKACNNKLTIEINPNSLKNRLFKVLPVSTAEMRVIGKHSPEEIAAARDVDNWYKVWQSKLKKMETTFEIVMVGDFARGFSTAERRAEVLSKVLAKIEEDLKGHNKLGLSDDALVKYLARMSVKFKALAGAYLDIFRQVTSGRGM